MAVSFIHFVNLLLSSGMIPFPPELRTVGWKGMSRLMDNGQWAIAAYSVCGSRFAIGLLDFAGDWPKLWG